MTSTMTASFGSEPETVFPQQDAQVSDLCTQYYHATSGYGQYPGVPLPLYNNATIPAATLPSNYNMPMQLPSRTHSYDSNMSSLSSYSTPATSYWSAAPSPLTQSQNQFYAAQQHAYYGGAVQPLSSQSYGPSPTRATFHDGSGLGLTFDEKHGRSQSYVSCGASHAMLPSDFDSSNSETSRDSSPSVSDLTAYGYINTSGTWSCNYPGCQSKAVFTRGCDLRKHHKRHTKSFFCRFPGCTQSCGGGFSSKKDLARHEAKHNPVVACDWRGCDRIFSRVDNMRDHVKRIHHKKQARKMTRSS